MLFRSPSVNQHQHLSRSLHALTARLDRAADGMLRREAGLSYSRFLILYMVGTFGAETQRSLAERLGVTEPSVSRMIGVLVDMGLLDTVTAPGVGNRRALRLTPPGQALLKRWGTRLESRLARLVEASGVPYREYLDNTTRLLATLDSRSTPPRTRR